MQCTVSTNVGTPFPFSTHVQELKVSANNRRAFRVYLLFAPALIPDGAGQPYRIELQWKATETYPNMGQEAEASSIMRWQGPAELVKLAIAFPRTSLGLRTSVRDLSTLSSDQLLAIDYHLSGEKLMPSEELPFAESVEGLRLEGDHRKYVVVGRRGQNLAQGEGIGFVIE